MSLVLDTSVVVDHLRHHAPATAALQAAVSSRRRVAASVLTRVEVRRNCPANQLGSLGQLDVFIDWVAVDHEIAALAAAHAEEYGLSHPGIDVTDYVVAATAQRLDAELMTRNLDRFPMFPDLRAPYELEAV